MLGWLRQFSFRLQLALVVLLVQAVLLGAVAWQGREVLDSHRQEQLTARVDQLNPLLAAALAVPLARKDHEALQDVATQVVAGNSLDYLVVADSRGHRIAGAGLAADQPLPAPTESLRGSQLHIRRQIFLAGQPLGIAQYGMPIRFIAEARDELEGRLLRIGAIGALLSLLLLVPLVLWLTRRLSRLKEAADAFAAGHLDQRIDLTGGDELARLAGAFDHMADVLAVHIRSLRHSETRFQYSVRGSNDGLWDWDLTTGDYYLSPRWKEMIGYAANELADSRDTFTAHLHPEDKVAVEEAIRRHFELRQPYDTEYRLRCRDGSYIWCRARGQAVWDENGKIVRFSGATTDISEQKAAAAHIQALLTEKQALLDNAVVGIAYLRQQQLVACNRRFEELFGYRHDEIIGRTTAKIYPSETVYEEISRAAYATISRGETYGFELSLRRRDGSSFWCHISCRAFDPAVPQDGSIWIFTDESERREALDAVLEAQAFSEAVINSLPGIFYLFDEGGHMLRWNANLETELGYRRRDIVRLAPLDLVAPEAWADTRKLIDLALATGEPTAGESTLRTRDGRHVPYFLTANAIDIQGRQMIVGVGIDLTARKHAEEQVRQLNEQLEQRVRERTAELTIANRELEAFSYSVSHDLSSPLRGIDGFARIIEEDYASHFDDQGRHYLQRIRAATQRMQTIIDDLLSLSRITRNELVFSTFSLSAMARQIIDELRDGQPGRQVDTVIADGIEVTGDANLLHLAINNLLRNAWKFTGKHPEARIELGVLHTNDEQVYFVRDDGAGFDMRYAGKLFGEFQRMHKPQEFEGTGIGLAITSRVIQRHGGRIWAEAAIEKGATFYFTLPRKGQ